MDYNWKQDPRLKGMDSKKLKYLTDFAEKVEHTPKDKLAPLLMGMMSGSNQMDFSDEETDLLVSILTADMNPAQKKQLETLKMLSKKMMPRR